VAEIQHGKSLEEESDKVSRANEELFDEAQRLSDKEAQWMEEKARLEEELVSGSQTTFVNIPYRIPFSQLSKAAVTRELESLKSELCQVEAMEEEASEKQAKMVSFISLPL